MSGGNFKDRLRTVDESGKRLWVYSDTVNGIWRKRRRIAAGFLLAFYFSVPWLRWSGHPVLQLDILHARIFFGGKIFGAHELAYFVPLLLGFAFAVFAVTAWKGRIWCGWACPQTVFLEFIYRPLERLIEGRGSQRKKLDQSLWTEDSRLMKKITKLVIYFSFSFLVANTFLALFVGTDALMQLVRHSPLENLRLFLLVLVVTFAFVFNFGWFREQMCTIACPYGRLQSILSDSQTTLVAYNAARGEPRGKLGTGGDCINCHLCVSVCPTGIDIRDGFQLECIGCMECSDACNQIMAKVNKSPNLIGYTSQAALSAEPQRKNWRPLVYGTFACLLTVGGLTAMVLKPSFDVQFMRNVKIEYKVVGDQVFNEFQLTLQNLKMDPIQLTLTTNRSDVYVDPATSTWTLAPLVKGSFTVRVVAPKDKFNEGSLSTEILTTTKDGESTKKLVHLWGPR